MEQWFYKTKRLNLFSTLYNFVWLRFRVHEEFLFLRNVRSCNCVYVLVIFVAISRDKISDAKSNGRQCLQ